MNCQGKQGRERRIRFKQVEEKEEKSCFDPLHGEDVAAVAPMEYKPRLPQ